MRDARADALRALGGTVLEPAMPMPLDLAIIGCTNLASVVALGLGDLNGVEQLVRYYKDVDHTSLARLARAFGSRIALPLTLPLFSSPHRLIE